MDLDGDLVVVTGASSGIGRETAVAMGAEGAHVVALARTESALAATADRVREAGGTATVCPADLTDRAATGAAAETVRADLGDPDVLVHCAGVGSWQSIPETDAGEAERIMGVSYFGPFSLLRAFLPAMIDRDRGRFVAVSSPVAYGVIPGATAYACSRYALRGLVESLHADLYSTGVGVTEVIPGKVDTEYFRRNDNVEERIPAFARAMRTLSPREVAVELVRATKGERRQVVMPPALRAALLADRYAPRTSTRLAAATGWQPGE